MARMIDLTMPLESGMIAHKLQKPPSPMFWKSGRHATSYQRFPTWEDPVLNPDGKSFSSENETLVLSAHTGTHMDAPTHVDPDSDVSIEDVDLERLHTDCVLLDVSDRAGEEEGIEREDLEHAAEAAGIDPDADINSGDTIFIRTGWSEEHLNDGLYNSHPGLTDSSAKWCIEQDIGLVGIDCPNIDLSTEPRQPSHIGFLRRGWPDSILVIESLYNLSALPSPTFEVLTIPLPFVDGSGSPVRVIALAE